MTGTVPNPGDIGEPTLVYDRIGTNKRQTWLMMLLFVAILGAFVPRYAIYLIVGPVLLVSVYLTLYSYVEYRRASV